MVMRWRFSQPPNSRPPSGMSFGRNTTVGAGGPGRKTSSSRKSEVMGAELKHAVPRLKSVEAGGKRLVIGKPSVGQKYPLGYARRSRGVENEGQGFGWDAKFAIVLRFTANRGPVGIQADGLDPQIPQPGQQRLLGEG